MKILRRGSSKSLVAPRSATNFWAETSLLINYAPISTRRTNLQSFIRVRLGGYMSTESSIRLPSKIGIIISYLETSFYAFHKKIEICCFEVHFANLIL